MDGDDWQGNIENGMKATSYKIRKLGIKLRRLRIRWSFYKLKK